VRTDAATHPDARRDRNKPAPSSASTTTTQRPHRDQAVAPNAKAKALDDAIREKKKTKTLSKPQLALKAVNPNRASEEDVLRATTATGSILTGRSRERDGLLAIKFCRS
jgi:hypothetical protein